VRKRLRSGILAMTVCVIAFLGQFTRHSTLLDIAAAKQ